MAAINWSPQYSVGIGELDRQHRQLVDMLNELSQATAQQKGREVLGGILGKLLQYTAGHFATEERLMARKNYPYLNTHKLEHEKLTQAALEFKAKFDQGQTAITVQLLALLKEWLVRHILKTDMLYSAALR